MAAEFLKKGWNLVGTTRSANHRTPLHELADEYPGRVQIEVVDICEAEQIAALRDRLSGRVFDILFVNSGTTNAHPDDTIAEVSTAEFIRVMITNTLGPMRAVEALRDLVAPKPGRSGATRWKRSASSGISSRNIWLDVGNPCNSSKVGLAGSPASR